MDSIMVTLSYSQGCHNRSFLKYCLFLAKYFFYVLLILFMDVVYAFFFNIFNRCSIFFFLIIFILNIHKSIKNLFTEQFYSFIHIYIHFYLFKLLEYVYKI